MANTGIFGKWSSYRDDNLEAVFSSMGMSYMRKKLGSSFNVTVSIEEVSGSDEIMLSVRSLIINTETRLLVGGKVRWNGGTSTEMDCFTCWEDGKLVIYISDHDTQNPKQSGRKQIRELLDNGELLLTIEWDGTIAKRWFRRC